jgi:hypothetical protein
MTTSIHAALGEGRLANPDAVLEARSSRVDGGKADGMRALDIRCWDGIDVRILPDRGFDIGQAWFAGIPLAWVSKVGESAPLDHLDGMDWSTRFGGGLMVTCGLRNVGMPSEGQGLHGTFSHLRATEVEVTRQISQDQAHLTARARISDPVDPILVVDRQIRAHAGRGLVEVTDRAINEGLEVADAPLLYHFNFGYPLWGPGARLDVDATETIPRDDASTASLLGWRTAPRIEDTTERVLEHVVRPDGGWGRAAVVNERLGVEVTIRWRAAELPRLHQWIDPSPGMAVLGVEPSNCSTRGRAFDRSEDRLPAMSPGEVRETKVSIGARRL